MLQVIIELGLPGGRGLATALAGWLGASNTNRHVACADASNDSDRDAELLEQGAGDIINASL